MEEEEWLNNLDYRAANAEAETACAAVMHEIRRLHADIKKRLADKGSKQPRLTIGDFANALHTDPNTLGKWLRTPPKKLQPRTLKNLCAATAYPELARRAASARNAITKARIARAHGMLP